MHPLDICNKCGRYRTEHDNPPTDIELFDYKEGFSMSLMDCLNSYGFEEKTEENHDDKK